VTLVLRPGDARAVMATIGPAFALAYLDPPFFTQRVHEMPDGETAFDDRWKSLEHFVGYVADLARAAWMLVVPGGSLVLHVDPKTSHYLKVALDTVCGRDAFASEIIWRYRRWPSKTRNFQRVHDVLLRWVKPEAEPSWNQLYEPLAPSTRATWGDRKQRAVVGEDGRRARSSVTEEATPGVPLGDVWDIGIIAPASKERTGYPTQKPAALLERIVLALTAPGDWVLDPTCGSGTTLAVSALHGRHAVGIDSSDVAIRVAKKRLASLSNLALADRQAGSLGAP
jgi:site-specific DNA-methyltransferase (adenine-specific)